MKAHKPVEMGEPMAEIVEANSHTINAGAFRKTLIAWGQKHFRPFPWRLTEDPYRILMAEVMLHRTQASQVVPVYERFVKRYPHVSALAQAKKEELHDILHSLGLRWRIDLIQTMAAELRAVFDGRVPETKEELLSLPGVSDYIASAVRCFAWNYSTPLVDTNTVRVTGRLFGLKIKDSSRRNRLFRDLIAALVDRDNPRAYNYALLDLADQVCMQKRSPECERCPLAGWCMYAGHR
jgi:A/G-specific adenine glycosylase